MISGIPTYSTTLSSNSNLLDDIVVDFFHFSIIDSETCMTGRECIERELAASLKRNQRLSHSKVDQQHSPGDNGTRIIGKLVFHLYLHFGYMLKDIMRKIFMGNITKYLWKIILIFMRNIFDTYGNIYLYM